MCKTILSKYREIRIVFYADVITVYNFLSSNSFLRKAREIVTGNIDYLQNLRNFKLQKCYRPRNIHLHSLFNDSNTID